ncbi:hypothetical protein [Nostoc sp.]|uniref:hypothetical protein n=1 Tax=Nostoc sp. TaxID=1180 RepID=UPI002FF803E4
MHSKCIALSQAIALEAGFSSLVFYGADRLNRIAPQQNNISAYLNIGQYGSDKPKTLM